MTTAAANTATVTDTDQRVELAGVGWEGYTAILRARGGRSRPRIVYSDGFVYLMSPSYPHESRRSRFGQFVMEVVMGLKIRCVRSGSTTFRLREKQGGVEPDESFYLANADRVRGKSRLRLGVDPPPDLVVEVVETHDAGAAVEVYRRLVVSEVWVCERDKLRVLALQPDGNYSESRTSVAFPFLTAAEIFEWIDRPQTETDTEWGTDLREWVRDVLAPRAAGPADDRGEA